MIGQLFKPLGPFNYNNFLTLVETYETKHSGLSNKVVDVFRIYPVNRRAKIDTGKFCNASCDFCYYKTQLNSQEFLTPEKAEEIAEYLISKGIEEFELSGGEPTISKHFQAIIEVLAKVQIRHNLPVMISVVTNGYLFRQENAKKLWAAQKYVNEWLISVHGFGEDHDNIVGTKGAFLAIDKFLRYNFVDITSGMTLVRLNIVVTPQTNGAKYKDDFMDFLLSVAYHFVQLNFLPLNYWSDAGENPEKINRSGKKIDKDLTETYTFINSFFTNLNMRHPMISKMNQGTSLLRSPLLNIRYAQRCFLNKDSAMFTRTTMDHVYDVHDWNRVLYPNDLDSYNYSAEEIYKIDSKDKIPFRIDDYNAVKSGEVNLMDVYNQSLIALRDVCQSHTKDDICSRCSFFNKCDGIKKEEDTAGNKTYRRDAILNGSIY